jgi:ankyrin repeat protein
MSYELNDVLKRCSDTASWFGVELHGVNSVNFMDDTPLHTVCTWGELESAKILIDAGADVNAKGDNGAPPLFNAVIGGNPKVIELLIKSGAKASLRNDDGRSVLEYARNINSSNSVLDILKKLG